MFNLNELETKIIKWCEVRKLDTQEPKDAYMKLSEEVGEIAKAMNKKDEALLADAVGDTLVCLIGLCKTKNINITDCLNIAWNEIKDRKGMLKDGLYVKYDDLLPKEQKELDDSIEV